MGVRQPEMHGCQPCFGTEADQNEDEGDFEPEAVERARVGYDPIQKEAGRMRLGNDEQQDAHKGQSDPDGADKEIFPGSFDGLLMFFKADQHGAGKGGGFHKDPDQTQVAAQARAVHGGYEEHHADGVDAALARCQLRLQPQGIEAHGKVEHPTDQEDCTAESIDVQALGHTRGWQHKRYPGKQMQEAVDKHGQVVHGLAAQDPNQGGCQQWEDPDIKV